MGFLSGILGRPPYAAVPDDRWDYLHPCVQPDRLRDGRTDLLELREVANLGKGLFARKSFRVGELVFVFDGKKETESQQPNVFVTGSSPNAIVVGRELEGPPSAGRFIWANPTEDSPLRWLNHSCNPNLARSPFDPFAFVALRDIAGGEQLVADYSLLETNPDWSMRCACGAPGCRGDIGAITSLSIERLRQSWDNIPRVMQEYALAKSPHPELQALVQKVGVIEAALIFSGRY